jgi:hypothetical protein
MVKVSIICLIVVFALLLEDGSSVKKKTEDEKKEDKEIQKAVNATLAEEERKRKEEEDEAKKKKNVAVKQESGEKDVGRQDEACPPVNFSCPVVKPCPPCPKVKECRQCETCKECPTPVGCQPCKECDSCPQCEESEESEECPPLECPPVYCRPCPVVNNTVETTPTVCQCPEAGVASLSMPAALAIGAIAGLLTAGVATVIGLILQYFSPFVSGFIFLATIIFIWYLCSQYPETARELGGRAANLLREAAVALGHRVMAAVQRHTEQVGAPTLSLVSSLE